MTDSERQIHASNAFGIMLQSELLIGAMASSISTCSGALNVPASCVANIAVFNGALSVLMQSTLAGDAVCNKKWVNKQIARFENQQNRVKIEATQFLKCQGSSTTFRHWKQSGLQVHQPMRLPDHSGNYFRHEGWHPSG